MSVIDESPLVLGEVGTYTAASFTNGSGEVLEYRIFVPPSYDPANEHPLVMYFQGAGGRGDSTSAHLFGANSEPSRVWAGPVAQAIATCIVVAPHVKTSSPLSALSDQWVDIPFNTGSHTQPVTPTAWMRVTIELLAQIQVDFNIDANRIYAVGTSMGGYGVWDILARQPGVFAGAIAASGAGDPSKASLIAQTPTLAYHGCLDTVVPVSGSIDMTTAVKRESGAAGLTLYPSEAHTINGRAFTLEAVEWLLAQDAS